MGPEQKQLMDRLFNDPTRRLLNFQVSRGEKPCTAEELCAELNIENGTAIVGCPDSGLPKRTVAEVVAEAKARKPRDP